MARKWGTIYDVCDAFANRRERPKVSSHRTVSHNKKYLYSYSTPIAVAISEDMFLLNNYEYSYSTSSHQRAVYGHIEDARKNKVSADFDYIKKIFNSLDEISPYNIVDYEEANYYYYYYAARGSRHRNVLGNHYDIKEKNWKEGGEWHPGITNAGRKYVEEKIIFRTNDNNYYLYTDHFNVATRRSWGRFWGQNPTLYSLYNTPQTIKECLYDILPTQAIIQYEKEGKLWKMGNWTFIPFITYPREAKKFMRKSKMERRSIQNLFTTRGVITNLGIFVAGKTETPYGYCQLGTMKSPEIWQALPFKNCERIA